MYWFGTTPPLISSRNANPSPRLPRLEAEVDFAELAATAALLLVAVLALRLALDGFAVGHMRLREEHFDAEALLQAIHHHFELEVTHAGDERLARARLVVATRTSGLPRAGG